MPGPQTCEWEWNGTEWVQLSGPTDCPPPPDPRGEPGDRKTTICPGGTG